jgi:sulfate transport system substrate-binding protein
VRRHHLLGLSPLAVALTLTVLAALVPVARPDVVELLNVSYDPTRELYAEINEAFSADYRERTGQQIRVRLSNGGSGSQANAVRDGLKADVVTLALWSDVDVLRVGGLLRADWDQHPPNGLPYTSTIVFVVRRGNPLGIRDWADLERPDVRVVTPNPKTSGNGKLSFLAAWGAKLQRGGDADQAREMMARLYNRQVPKLDLGARGAAITFQSGLGDVHLTWENEAHLEVAEAKGALEIVYPSVSIRAEPYVAVVDANVDQRGTRAAAEAYLRFLYTPRAQEIIARHYYRPADAEVLKNHAPDLPPLDLFPVGRVAHDWQDAQDRYFGKDGVFDQIYLKK